jgi:methionine-S-sulfoxide reductase
VVRTRVGYAGGTKANPTYYDLGDHSETIQIDYGPAQISYADLLDLFWASHSPASRPTSRQYMSIIFYHDEAQKALAEESREREAARLGRQVFTEIVPASGFTAAEEYHQKYTLQQQHEIMSEFRAIYPDGGWVDSTAVARANGYLGGNGSLDRLQAELSDLGLSPEAGQRLLAIAQRAQR